MHRSLVIASCSLISGEDETRPLKSKASIGHFSQMTAGWGGMGLQCELEPAGGVMMLRPSPFSIASSFRHRIINHSWLGRPEQIGGRHGECCTQHPTPTTAKLSTSQCALQVMMRQATSAWRIRRAMPGEHCVGGTTGHRRCIFVALESDKPTIGPPSPPPELGPAKGQTWPQQPLEVCESLQR